MRGSTSSPVIVQGPPEINIIPGTKVFVSRHSRKVYRAKIERISEIPVAEVNELLKGMIGISPYQSLVILDSENRCIECFFRVKYPIRNGISWNVVYERVCRDKCVYYISEDSVLIKEGDDLHYLDSKTRTVTKLGKYRHIADLLYKDKERIDSIRRGTLRSHPIGNVQISNKPV